MASLQIEKGSFPRYGNRRITDIEYVERGDTTQDVNYTYSEVDTSITPDTYYYPNTSGLVAGYEGDPTDRVLYNSVNGTINSVIWQDATSIKTYNAGTSHEFTLPVVTSATAYAGTTNVKTVYAPSDAASHNYRKDYHEYIIYGTRSTLSSDDRYTLVTNERGTLHTVWEVYTFETRTDPDTGQTYVVKTGTEPAEATSTAMSLVPVLDSATHAHTAYNCALQVSEVVSP